MEDLLATLNKLVECWWKTKSFGTKFDQANSRYSQDKKPLRRLEDTTNFRTDVGQYGLLWMDERSAPKYPHIGRKDSLQILVKNVERAKVCYETLEIYFSKGYARRLPPAEAARSSTGT